MALHLVARDISHLLWTTITQELAYLKMDGAPDLLEGQQQLMLLTGKGPIKYTGAT